MNNFMGLNPKCWELRWVWAWFRTACELRSHGFYAEVIGLWKKLGKKIKGASLPLKGGTSLLGAAGWGRENEGHPAESPPCTVLCMVPWGTLMHSISLWYLKLAVNQIWHLASGQIKLIWPRMISIGLFLCFTKKNIICHSSVPSRITSL